MIDSVKIFGNFDIEVKYATGYVYTIFTVE